MVTHKRLKELFNQDKSVFFCGSSQSVSEITKDMYINNVFFYSQCLSEIFETKEEAEWHKEFGCIEKTERLELPTWEEWQKDDGFDFLDKDGFSWDTYITGDNEIIMANGWKHFTFENNKEGYFLACRKAKELFLGEE